MSNLKSLRVKQKPKTKKLWQNIYLKTKKNKRRKENHEASTSKYAIMKLKQKSIKMATKKTCKVNIF